MLGERTVRHQRILGLFDRHRGVGLEIGPLFDPVVLRDDADVRYVDVHSAENLREYYSAHPGVPLDDIVDPHYVIIGPDGPRTLPEAVAEGAPFRWVVASHVIEHVPDLVGWFAEIADVLEDDGELVLAIPDRRYCFDARRDPTTIGEMLLAHHHADKIPSVRAVYDHFRNAVTINAEQAWTLGDDAPTTAIHDLPFVREQLRLSVEDRVYVDCHVWLFTPQLFVDQLAELARMDLVEFVVDRIVPTAPYELEFYAVLRRVPRGLHHAGAARVRTDLTDLDGAPPVVSAGSGFSVTRREQQLVEAKRRIIDGLRRSVSRANHAIRKAN